MAGGKTKDEDSSGDESKLASKRTSSPDDPDGDTDSQDGNRRSRRKKPRVGSSSVSWKKVMKHINS